MDGDVLVKPSDFQKFLNYKKECLIVTKEESDESVFVKVDNGKAVEFNSNDSFIWSGIAKIETVKLKKRNDYIYKMLEPLLPIDTICLETREIDTQEDYEQMVEWINNNYIEKNGVDL